MMKPRLQVLLAAAVILVAVAGCASHVAAPAFAPSAPAAVDSTRDVAHEPTVAVVTTLAASVAPTVAAAPARKVKPKAKPKPKPKAKAKAKPKPKPLPKTLPERMRRMLPGSRQLIVVTGARLGSNAGNLSLYDLDGGHWRLVLSTHAAFGLNGLVNGATRKSGHLQTPTGIWRIGSFLFGQHAAAPSGTKMRYRPITQRSWWSSVPDSTYNTWVDSGSYVSGEHLADSTVQYELAFDSGYNAPPNQRVIGRGTAIFIHCSEPPGNSLGVFTHGCVAIDRGVMKRLFTLLDPARKPTCAIGTLRTGTPTAIYSY